MSPPTENLRWTVLLALGLAAAVASTAWWVFQRYVVERPDSARPSGVTPAPAPAASPMAEVVRVTAVQGMVERSSGSTWVQARPGDRLGPDESLRTARHASADLQVGDEDSRLTMPEGSELRVREVTRAVHTFRLSRGRIAVDYRPDGERVLRIEAESGAVAQTRGARFTVLRTGTVVAVATESGAVDLSATSGSVRVGPGQQAIVHDGQAPSAAEEIPAEVLLKVARRAAEVGLCVVEGRVHPGTEVQVEEAVVAVGTDGRFRARVPWRPGLEVVQVRAVAPGGGERRQQVPCHAADAPTPKAQIRIDWNAEP